MKYINPSSLFVLIILILLQQSTHAQVVGNDTKHVRFGLGTDVSGGVVYGVEFNILKEKDKNGVELGAMAFGGKFKEDSNNGFNDYHEETSVFVIAVLANYIIDYGTLNSPYFVFGFGAGIISIDWSESSPTDPSLGTPFGSSGSMTDESTTTAGTILNIGMGYRFSEKIDLRAQIPTFIILGGVDKASSTIPTFTVTLGIAI